MLERCLRQVLDSIPSNSNLKKRERERERGKDHQTQRVKEKVTRRSGLEGQHKKKKTEEGAEKETKGSTHFEVLGQTQIISCLQDLGCFVLN